MDTSLAIRRAPALPPGLDQGAYLAAGGIAPGALLAPQPDGRTVVITEAPESERVAGAAFYRAFGSTQLASTEDPRIADLNTGRHPILGLTEQIAPSGYEHAVQLLVLHAMRRYYPTLDAAIRLRRVLEGDVVVTSEDEGLQDALQQWWDAVPVGYIEGAGTLTGGDVYLDQLAASADEYGLSAGEVLVDETGTTVERLVVPSSRTLSLEEVPGSRQEYAARGGIRYRLVQHRVNGGRAPLDGPLVQTLAFRGSHGGSASDVWPEPLAWSLVQTTEVVLHMFQSVLNVWWRLGDPSMLLGIEYDKDMMDLEVQNVATATGSVEVPSELLLFKNTVEEIMRARRRGLVGDAYVATQGGKIRNEVLGQVDATMMRYFREQRSTFDADVVGQSEVPVWMFPTIERPGDGLGGSLSNNQAAIAATGAHKRNRKKLSLAQEVIDTHLLVTGDARWIGRYELEASEVNVMDEQLIAETRRTVAEAVEREIANVVQAWDEEGNRRFSGEAERVLEGMDIYN